MHMTQNYLLLPHKGNFPGKNESGKSIQICLEYSLSIFLLSTLMAYVKNI